MTSFANTIAVGPGDERSRLFGRAGALPADRSRCGCTGPRRRPGVGERVRPGGAAAPDVQELAGPVTWAMRRCPRATSVSTISRTPGTSSTDTDPTAACSLAGSGRPSVIAGRPSSAIRAGRGSATRRSVEQHAVHALLGREPAVGGEFGLGVGDDGEQERLLARGQDSVRARDEGGEERVGTDPPRGSRDDERDGRRRGAGQCTGRMTRPPAERRGDVEDPAAGLRRDAGPVVQREGHRARGHPGALRDVRDGDPPGASGTDGIVRHVSD